MDPNNSSGQSLFEVVVSLGIVSFIILALVSLVSISIRNSLFSKNTTNATRYSQEATEWLRGERDKDWNAFAGRAASIIWCLPSLSWATARVGNCGTNDVIANTSFRREVTLAILNATSINAEVKVSWNDARGLHETKSSTTFTNWRGGGTFLPTPTPAIPTNVARSASVIVSSEYSATYAGTKAIDGIIGQNNVGEWASLGQLNPWIQLNWASAQTVDRVRLYDRVNLTDWAPGGTLSFSDGSSIGVSGIPNNGTVKEVTFTAKSITWVRFQVAGGRGVNVGLSEFEVWFP